MASRTLPTPEDYYALPSHLDRASFDFQAESNAEITKHVNPMTWVATPTPDQQARQHPALAARQAVQHPRHAHRPDVEPREDRRNDEPTPIVAPTPVRVARAILRTPPSAHQAEATRRSHPERPIESARTTDEARVSDAPQSLTVVHTMRDEHHPDVAQKRDHSPSAVDLDVGREDQPEPAVPPSRAPLGKSTSNLLAWLSSDTPPTAIPPTPSDPIPNPIATPSAYPATLQPPSRYPVQTQTMPGHAFRAFGFTNLNDRRARPEDLWSREREREGEPRPHWGPPPRYDPGPAYERQESLRRSRPFKLGGRSKNEELGSVEESWGPVVMVAEDGEVVRAKGMFQIRDDPPSRSASPFQRQSSTSS